MNLENEKGILIALEGIDGAGKTTQVQLLGQALAEFNPILAKEPTDGPWGQKIRNSANNGRMSAQEELEAFIQDRKEHVEKVIGPALREGKIVVLDRYFYSTIAYQGERLGLSEVENIRQKNLEMAPVPDMVFLLDIDPRISVSRIGGRGDTPNHFEQVEALSRVRGVFNSLANSDNPIFTLDGTRSIQEIHQTIISLFIDGALKKKRCATA